MGADKEFTIFHFDDELESVQWLARAVMIRFRDERRDLRVKKISETESDEEYIYKFSVDDLIFTYWIVSNQKAALKQFRPTDKDLLFLDINVYGAGGTLLLQGFHLLDEFKKSISTNRIFIVSCALSQLGNRHTGLKPDHLIHKPLDVSVIQQIVAEHFFQYMPPSKK